MGCRSQPFFCFFFFFSRTAILLKPVLIKSVLMMLYLRFCFDELRSALWWLAGVLCISDNLM